MAVPATPNFDQGAATSAIDSQKAALLAALAQGGSAMAQGQAATQAAMGASSQAAAQQAAARAVNPAQATQATSAANQQGAYYQGVAGQQASAAQSFMSNAGKTNDTYMSQLGAAVPLVHEQTQQSLNSMQNAAGQAEADRALRLQIAQMQLEQSKNSLAASDPNVDHRTADEKEHDRLVNAGLQQQLDGSKALTPAQQLDQINLDAVKQGQAADASRQALLDQEGPAAAAAARLAMSGAKNQAEALANLQAEYKAGQAKTPGNRNLDQKYMQGLLARIYAIR